MSKKALHLTPESQYSCRLCGTSTGTISTCEVSSLPANVVPAMREKDAAPDKYCTVEIDRVLSQLAYCKFQNGKFSAAEPAGKRPGAP